MREGARRLLWLLGVLGLIALSLAGGFAFGWLLDRVSR